ncbi:MAG: Crp/Fnr family transcriptional regulator [Bacteroidales bacterium]|jgi:CRP-like cAMP-binding protein
MEEIYNCPLFRGVDKHTLESMIDGKCRVRDLSRGETVAIQDQMYKSLIIVEKGTLRAEMTNREGVKAVIEDISAPRAVAPSFLFSSKNRLPVTLTALMESTVISIPKNVLLWLMKKDARILENMLNSISDRCHFLSERVRLLQFGTIKSKLRSYFMEQKHNSGSGTFTIPHTQQELADTFGVTRPALARAIKQMEQAGTIVRKGIRTYEFH